MNQRCCDLVAAKRAAEGKPEYKEKVKLCSEGILEEFHRYVGRVRDELNKLPRSSKKWWKLAKGVALQSEKNSAIPPLKAADGSWVTGSQAKCNLFLNTFTGKYELAREEENAYTELRQPAETTVSGFLPIRARLAKRVLRKLNPDKATGPDLLSAKVLQKCAEELAVPVAKLARKIL